MTRQPPRNLALGPGPEFDRIRQIARVLGTQTPGLGDDCGLIREGEEFFALSTDVSVEGIHFRPEWIGPEEVGWRATASALSDLAAEGAEAVGVLCAVTMPAQAPEKHLMQVMSGAGAAAKFAGAMILGGDLSSGPVWSVAVTVVGRTRAPVTRGGAEPGDRLWVSGTLGGSRAALEAFRRGEAPLPGARTRFARPEPRIAAGRWLARHGAHAMLDLSDGLGGDAWHLAAASKVALEINLDSVPVAPEANGEAERLGVPPQRFAAEGGEDFELLVALPPRFNATEAFVHECGIGLTQIGTVRHGSGVRFELGGGSLDLHGFNHFPLTGSG
ncbi:MAG TPA: thiamine-phosphate kinase [Gemmatimonadales bacterium]|nr:thiamine-phosphate kinase [Gemmatimonadales bacterium]